MNANIKIYNLPPYPIKRYTVVRLVEGKLWFYGTYDEQSRAEAVRGDFDNGLVIERVVDDLKMLLEGAQE